MISFVSGSDLLLWLLKDSTAAVTFVTPSAYTSENFCALNTYPFEFEEKTRNVFVVLSLMQLWSVGFWKITLMIC